MKIKSNFFFLDSFCLHAMEKLNKLYITITELNKQIQDSGELATSVTLIRSLSNMGNESRLLWKTFHQKWGKLSKEDAKKKVHLFSFKTTLILANSKQ